MVGSQPTPRLKGVFWAENCRMFFFVGEMNEVEVSIILFHLEITEKCKWMS